MVSDIRASPPLRVKGSAQALWRGVAEKSAPPFLPGLFKLRAPLTILPGERCSWWAQIPGPHPLAISKSCYFWVEATLQGIFLTVLRIEEPVCKVRVGECHSKKFSACLEPFKAHFKSLPWRARVEMLLCIHSFSLAPKIVLKRDLGVHPGTWKVASSKLRNSMLTKSELGNPKVITLN